MKFEYVCSKCNKSDWKVSFDTELQDHVLTCLKCNDTCELKSLSRTLNKLKRAAPRAISPKPVPKPTAEQTYPNTKP